MEPKDLLDFDRLLFPSAARPLYLLSLVLTTLAGGYWIWLGLNHFAGGYLVLYGLLHLTVGPIVMRILFEALICLFLIQQHLAALRSGRAEPSGPPSYMPPPPIPPPAYPQQQHGYRPYSQ